MNLLDHKYDKHYLVTLIVLIVLPIVLGFSNFFSEIYYARIISFFLVYTDNPYLGFQILYVFQYIIFAVMLVAYPIYPFTFSMEKYFGDRNPWSAIAEYDFLKKIVYVLFPFFILAVGFMILPRIMSEDPLSGLIVYISDSIIISIFFTILGVIFFVVGSALLRIVLLNVNRDFRFYFARISFRMVSKVEKNMEKMRYLIIGLNSYNKYIRRNLGLQINDLRRIYSTIITDPTIDKNRSFKELSIAFEEDDRLKAICCLTKLFGISDTEHFLVKEALGKKLQDWAGILGTLASTTAAILGALGTLKIPGLS